MVCGHQATEGELYLVQQLRYGVLRKRNPKGHRYLGGPLAQRPAQVRDGVPVPPLRASSRRSHQCMYLDGPGRMHVGGGSHDGRRSTEYELACRVHGNGYMGRKVGAPYDTLAHLAADDKISETGRRRDVDGTKTSEILLGMLRAPIKQISPTE